MENSIKKTLLVSLDFWPRVGGVANYCYNLCLGVKNDVVILTSKTKESFDIVAGNNLKIYRRRLLNKYVWPKWLAMIFYAWKIAKKEKIEMLWAGDLLPTGTAVMFVSKVLNIPYIVSCYGMDILQAKKSTRKKNVAKRVLKNAKQITTCSEYTKSLILALGIDKEKIKVIYPGIRVDDKKTKVDVDKMAVIKKQYKLENKKILLSVGRLVERKGFHDVVGMLPEIIKKNPNLVYVIVGNGELEEKIKTEIKNKKLERNVLLLSNMSDEEKWIWFELCDTFIMLTRESSDDVEGFGIVYLEANLFGKPVIAASQGGVKEAVVDGVTGILINPGDERSVTVGSITKLMTDKTLSQKMGQIGKQRVERDFDWSGSIRKLIEMLK